MILSPLWLPATLLAALFQSWRTALQQKLRGSMSVNAAGLVRYLYGAPTALVLLVVHVLAFGGPLPLPGAAMLGWTLLGGLAQIGGTNALLMAFAHRNFVVGSAYAKTDAVQGAILAAILLGEALRPLAWLGVACSVAGVVVLSLAGRSLRPAAVLRATVQPAALWGLGAGLGFALAGVFIKLGAAELIDPAWGEGWPVRRALMTLLLMNLMQSAAQGGWMLWREPAQLRAAVHHWRHGLPVGALSALGSACWFTGFVLAPLGLVRSVGQVEILVTLALGRFYLREAFTRVEVLGAAVVVAGVLLVLAGA